MNEEDILFAETIYNKLKFYCDFNGLDFLNISKSICISNLIPFIEEEIIN